MKRIATAILIIALTLFFGVSGEHRTADAADRLCRDAQELRELCVRFDENTEHLRERIDKIRSEWDEKAGTLTFYMNAHNLRPVKQALRDVKDAAADGDADRLDSALRKLSYAVDDLRDSEKLSLENVF